MKFYLPLTLTFFLAFMASMAAQQILFQGFEGSAQDNFSFTVSPAAYNNIPAEDVWSDTTATSQISPAGGNRQWFMRDLENPSGGGAFEHRLDFGPVDISAFTANTLSFQFHTLAYDSDDSIGYYIAYDNGTDWNTYVPLNKNSQGWETVTINAPAGAAFIRLRLAARQNGGSDYAAWDNIQLSSANGDVVAPLVVNAVVNSSTGIRLVFSEPMSSSVEDINQYTGVPDLASATRNSLGDTLWLAFNTPFVNGQPYALTVNNVTDVAGNALQTPYTFAFTYNNSTPTLVITEINYNPPSNDPDTLEFIEIYNHGTADAILGGLKLDGAVQMTLPSVNLPAGGVFLAAANKAACESFFTGQTFVQWSSGVLTNGGNTLVLRNSDGVTLDTVQYDDAFPWPLEPDGLGPSAELLSPNLNNNDGANWVPSTTVTGSPTVFASPGVVTIAMLPTISFVNARTLVQENAGVIKIPVKVDNLNVPLAEARLRVASASTAVAGDDYILLDTFVAFPAGTTTPFEVSVEILDNADLRDSRYLFLQLFDFTASQVGSVAETSILINDNDTPAPTPQANAPIKLRHLSSFAVDAAGGATAEISAFDPVSKRLFTTNINQNKLAILDLKNPVAITKVASIDMSPYGGGLNSVAYANGTVAVAVDDSTITNPGKVVFLDVNGAYINAITAGALPDHLNFSPDASKLLVANEGEPATDYSVDPEGSVTVVDMTPGAAALTQANVTQIGFTQFNSDSAALVASGIRIFGPGSSVAEDLEPEYVTVSSDGNTAWVTLQENNALAVIDLQSNTVTALLPLGTKGYAGMNMSLDASDQAPGIFFNNWNVKGMYQPDAIAYWNAGGTGYLITANEGDAREWDANNEILRVNSSSYKLDPVAFPDATYLKRAELLGRLNVTTKSGDTDGDGDFDEIHTLGGRSISIWNASTGALVWDSGDDLERITAADPVYGAMFNASNSNNTRKNRSDDKGPEPEGVALGTIEGRNYAFTALERIGGVLVYDVTNPQAPEYVQWINTRVLGSTAGGDLGPEGIIFIPKAQSPNKRDLILVSNEISGTVSVFEIEIDRTKTGEFGLIKYAFDETPAIGVYGDTIREGGISGLMYRDGSYRFVADRGPNADAVNHPLAMGATALVFPFPDYAPKTWKVRPENGALTVEDFDFIKRPDGTGASGLPLHVGQGNTGEVAWADTNATVLNNDAWGLDSEGLIQDNEGNFWVCDEYGTSIWKLDADFKVIQRFTPFPVETEDAPLDTLLGRRRPNRGLEGVAYTPNGKIYAIIQSPLFNPNAATGASSRIHRLVELDPATGTMKTFVYVHDPVLGQIRSTDWKMGDLAAVNNHEFLVLEHAERNGWNAKNIYKFSIENATPVSGNDFGGLTLEQLNDPAGLAANGIVPVQKELFLDLLEMGWERQHDKPEGLAVVNDSTIAVINDNDFGIASPNADGLITLTGKTTRLYEYHLPADKHLDYVSPYCQVSLGQDFVTCGSLEAVLELGSQGVAQAIWSDGNTDVNRLIDSAGTYAVTAVTAFGCTSRDTITIGQSDFPSVDLGDNQPLCPGASLTLDAGVHETYLWSNGETTQSITVSSAGGYAVSVTNAFGCEGTGFVFINAAQNPVVDLGPNKNLCAGQTLTLDAGNAGATYLWSNGETTQTIAANVAGSYTVTVTSTQGCVGSDVVALVNAATPNVNLGADVITCEGQTITLSNGYPGAATVWSTGATSASINVTSSGVYSVQVTLVTGCSDTDTVAINILPNTVATVNGSACAGQFFVYQGTQIPAGATQQFTLVNSLGCDSIVTVIVAENPLPVIALGADTTICSNQTLALNAGNPGAQYAWSNGATGQSITVNTENVYVVTVTNAQGCTATDDILVEVETCVGVTEASWASTLEVFPNPTSTMLNMQAQLPQATEVHWELLNAIGQQVLAAQNGVTDQIQESLDVRQLPQGAYLLRIKAGQETVTHRIVIQR
ncbi:MAG: choice-of-anchor I family protein [Chitinophagales bacterium]|nr:choice-of-anchor I family protein [Chitinophagales bacterium]